MAMRPRRSSFRTQPSLRPANEAFQPKSEMKENQEAFILQIQLPGFTKERLRIQYEESSRTVKVSGERPIDGGKRWNSFKQAYHIPENCEAARIQSKFSQGILTITMPKKLISQAAPKVPSPPKKAEKVPDFIPPESAITARVEEPRDKKSASLPSTSSSVRTFDDLKAQKGQEDTPAQRPFDSQEPAEKGLRPMKPSELIWAEKGQGEIMQKSKMTMEADPEKKTDGELQKIHLETEPKLKLKMVPRKTTDKTLEKDQEEIKQNTTLTTVARKLADENTMGRRDEDAEKERVSKKEAKEAEGKLSESRKLVEGVVEKGMVTEKEIKARRELAKEDEHSAPKHPEKEKVTNSTAAAAANDAMIDTIGKGIKEVAASAFQAYTKIAEGKWEVQDKPLLVNMGASVLVIAALGVYVYSRFASSGRT